jgi:hypothetical protein
MAVATALSQKTSPQSLKALLVVRIMDPASALLEMTWKKRSRPCLSKGRYPSSSMISSLGTVNFLRAPPQTVVGL